MHFTCTPPPATCTDYFNSFQELLLPFLLLGIQFILVFSWRSPLQTVLYRCPAKFGAGRQTSRVSSSHKNTKFLATRTKISTFPLLGPNIYSSSTVLQPDIDRKVQQNERNMWRLEIGDCRVWTDTAKGGEPNIYSSSTVFSRTLTERYSKMRGICGDWRLEIVDWHCEGWGMDV